MPIMRRVLPDEEYEEQLEAIINRDFYPRLKRLREEQKAAAAPSTVISDEQTDPHDSDGFPIPLSLDAFQATHVNQDDLSFARILELDNQQRRARLAWMLESSERHNQHIENLKADLDNYETLDVGGQLVGGDELNRLEEIFSSGGVITNKHQATTRLMGGPSGSSNDILAIQGPGPLTLALEPGLIRQRQLAGPAVDLALKYHPVLAKPIISHSSTRFGEDEDEEAGFLDSVEKRAVEQAQQVEALQNACRIGEVAAAKGDFTNNQVRAAIPGLERTPLILPENAPVMTWGTIGATPITVLECDNDPVEYSIPACSSRDTLAYDLHDSKIKKQREKTRSALSLKEELQELHRNRTGSIKNKTQRSVLDTPLARELSKRVTRSKMGNSS